MKEKLLLLGLVVLSVFVVASFYLPGTNTTTTNQSAQETDEVSFVVYGDTRTNLDRHRQVVSQISRLDPQFVVNTGDLVENGSREVQWKRFQQIISPLPGDYYPAVGNHEQWNAVVKTFMRDHFPIVRENGYYSLNRAGIHWIFLNQYQPYDPGSRQYQWLRAELDDGVPTAVVMHEPHFKANHSANIQTRAHLVPLIKAYDVELVFYGHSHMFGLRRSEGVTYVVAAGGGAPLYAPNPETLDHYERENHFIYFRKKGSRLTGEVIGIEGESLYQFSVHLEETEEPAPSL